MVLRLNIGCFTFLSHQLLIASAKHKVFPCLLIFNVKLILNHCSLCLKHNGTQSKFLSIFLTLKINNLVTCYIKSHKYTFVSKQFKQPTRATDPLSKQQRSSKTNKKSTLCSSRLMLRKMTVQYRKLFPLSLDFSKITMRHLKNLFLIQVTQKELLHEVW